MTKLIVTLRNFPNAPKSLLLLHTPQIFLCIIQTAWNWASKCLLNVLILWVTSIKPLWLPSLVVCNQNFTLGGPGSFSQYIGLQRIFWNRNITSKQFSTLFLHSGVSNGLYIRNYTSDLLLQALIILPPTLRYRKFPVAKHNLKKFSVDI